MLRLQQAVTTDFSTAAKAVTWSIETSLSMVTAGFQSSQRKQEQIRLYNKRDFKMQRLEQGGKITPHM